MSDLSSFVFHCSDQGVIFCTKKKYMYTLFFCHKSVYRRRSEMPYVEI